MFSLSDTVESTKIWKLNPELLLIEQVQEDIQKELDEYFRFNANCDVSKGMIWDTMKAVIRGRVIVISSAFKKKRAKMKEDLLADIARLERQHKTTCNTRIYKELQDARKKLEAPEVSKIKKNMLYLMQKYWLKSPKGLKLLAWKVKERKGSVQAHTITDAEKKKHTMTPKILDVFKDFYSRLYSSSHPLVSDMHEFWQTHRFQAKLSSEHKAMLDELVTQDEVLATIRHMKNNKSPGCDGFGVEYCKKYALTLAPHLTAAFNEVLRGGTVPPSWNEATVVVILKAGRDTGDPKSYRPISLLNNDYKVFTALLTARLNKIILSNVHHDQAGFIPGRDILDNIYCTLEVIHHCKAQKGDSTLLLLLDVEKAFDRVEHGYILSLLQHMNFGPHFITAIKAIYATPTASVKVNRLKSERFAISRGTWQGCPLLPLLFVLAIEPLAEAFRNLTDFKGIYVGKRRQAISLFADDMVLYVSKPESSLPAIIRTLDNFSRISGLTVNADKSLIFPIQIDRELQTKLREKFPFTWVQDHWRYLGVHSPLDFSQFSCFNLDRINDEVRGILKTWDTKRLSWFDRLQLAKAMIFPKYLFLFRTAPLGITKQSLQRWQHSLLDFIWQY